MRIYQRKESHPMKWVIALIIFVLIMTVTWDEVEGITIPTNTSTSTTQTADPSDDNNSDPAPAPLSQRVLNDGGTDPSTGDESVPSTIPEPGTLILLAGGITAFHLMRRRSK